jgi:hypothetical protein
VPILRDCVIHYGGVDLTATANEFGIDSSFSDLDVTTFGSAGNHERIAGLEDATASVMTFGDPAIVEPALSTKPGTVELLTAVQFPTGGVATAGDRTYSMRGLLTSTKQPLKVGDVSKLDATMPAAQAEGLLAGQLLAPKASISATTNGTAVNLGAVSTGQLAYFGIHVFSLTGDRTVTLKLQSATSSGFSSPSDRVTLSTITAAGSGFGSSNTTTAHAWWRVVATLGGTTGSVTFAAFAAIQ